MQGTVTRTRVRLRCRHGATGYSGTGVRGSRRSPSPTGPCLRVGRGPSSPSLDRVGGRFTNWRNLGTARVASRTRSGPTTAARLELWPVLFGSSPAVDRCECRPSGNERSWPERPAGFGLTRKSNLHEHQLFTVQHDRHHRSRHNHANHRGPSHIHDTGHGSHDGATADDRSTNHRTANNPSYAHDCCPSLTPNEPPDANDATSWRSLRLFGGNPA